MSDSISGHCGPSISSRDLPMLPRHELVHFQNWLFAHYVNKGCTLNKKFQADRVVMPCQNLNLPIEFALFLHCAYHEATEGEQSYRDVQKQGNGNSKSFDRAGVLLLSAILPIKFCSNRMARKAQSLAAGLSDLFWSLFILHFSASLFHNHTGSLNELSNTAFAIASCEWSDLLL
jgi:hypothetical protein